MRYFCLFTLVAAPLLLSGCNRQSSLSAASETPLVALQSCRDETVSIATEPILEQPSNRLTLKAASYRGTYPIRAVCTTSLVADLVRTVGGESVAVKQLIGAEYDPHLYKVSAGDIAALESADIVFYCGLGLEAKFGDLFARLASAKPAYAVTQYIDASKLLKSETSAPDPHVFLDVSLWRQAIEVVRDALSLFDPAHADLYQRRAAAYSQQLEQLHAECQRRLADVPRERRFLVSAHNAFHYFGRAYHFEVRGIKGTATSAPAGPHEVDSLASYIIEQNIKTVFTETTTPDRGIITLVESCRAKGQKVTSAGPLYGDGLGPPSSEAGTYIGMMRHNIDSIVNALQ